MDSTRGVIRINTIYGYQWKYIKLQNVYVYFILLFFLEIKIGGLTFIKQIIKKSNDFCYEFLAEFRMLMFKFIKKCDNTDHYVLAHIIE